MQKRRWKDCELQGWCMVPRKHSLPDPVELMHIGTHRDWGSTHKICIHSNQTVSPGSYLQLVPAGNGQISFLQWCATGYINHSTCQGSLHAQEQFDNTKTNSILWSGVGAFCFILFWYLWVLLIFLCVLIFILCVWVCKVWKRKQMQEVVGEGGGEE